MFRPVKNACTDQPRDWSERSWKNMPMMAIMASLPLASSEFSLRVLPSPSIMRLPLGTPKTPALA
eukprot:13282989-Alexandrium_andersonii.AAC.1